MPSRYTRQSLRRRTGAYDEYDIGGTDDSDHDTDDEDFDPDAMFDELIPAEVEVEEEDPMAERDVTMATVNTTMDDYVQRGIQVQNTPPRRPAVRTRSQTAAANQRVPPPIPPTQRREFQQPAEQRVGLVQATGDNWLPPMEYLAQAIEWEQAVRAIADEQGATTATRVPDNSQPVQTVGEAGTSAR